MKILDGYGIDVSKMKDELHDFLQNKLEEIKVDNDKPFKSKKHKLLKG